MTQKEPDLYLKIGFITKVHGLRGGLKIRLFDYKSDVLSRVKRIFILDQNNNYIEYTIARHAKQNPFDILYTKELTHIDQVEILKNKDIYINSSALPKLNKNEYYLYELMGMDAKTIDGVSIGKIEGLLTNQEYSTLVIIKDKKEILIPALETYIKEVNKELKIIYLENIDELIKLYAI
jgi:16S rRNA processing protein RimM